MILSLSQQLEDLFWQLSENEPPARLATDVVRLSDFYLNNKGARTPWGQRTSLRAYAVYFLPLNVARLQAVWNEVQRFIPQQQINEIWDFGSGLGATHWMLEDQNFLSPRKLVCLETDERAVEQHETLMTRWPCRWEPRFNLPVKPGPKAMAVFSYSFLEMQEQLPPLEQFAHLLIVEPSFKETGRALMKWRTRWIQGGFTPLAPCTHSLACPLLVHSDRDWCHHRVQIDLSSRFAELQSHLPMKNHTVTFSYLLMSQTVESPLFRGSTRVIGDTLREKGKTRQMICRGPEREFLTWMSRDGDPEFIPHGSLIPSLGAVELKSNEVRVKDKLDWVE
jgi:ribosomal protein RSM22 (predicted rRNA methylase)